MFMPASCSMDASWATMALRSAMALLPTAMVVVDTTGRAMGIDAITSTTAKPRAWRNVSPLTRRTMRQMPTTTSATETMVFMIVKSTFWKWGTSLTLWIMAAVLPKYVFAPVSATMASHSPWITWDPILAFCPCSNVTGRDSPVKAAWSMSTGGPGQSRQSAGTAAPAVKATRSPGTSSPAWQRLQRPFRFTTASGLRLALRAAMALPARFASLKARQPFTTCKMKSTTKFAQSCTMASMTMAIQIM
mmetsp:Transcript_10250/g.29257  ORF Transcript_10250/g.29257 Transcript_10250/m.29257 type:complete len:247 (+) Transcript_10250:1716-2456(+)